MPITGVFRQVMLLAALLSAVAAASASTPMVMQVAAGQHPGIIGQSMPGDWRPFSDDSPWNSPVGENPAIHPDNDKIMATVTTEAKSLALITKYLTPIWVVDSGKMPLVRVRSDRIYDTWDKDNDGWSDDGVPLVKEMWGEPTEDGQICIIDPARNLLWDISTYRWSRKGLGDYPTATTLDVWNLKGSGMYPPGEEGTRWVLRGGRGSGIPALAGIIRPEELEVGEIRHALCFSFTKMRGSLVDRQHIFLPPASRSEGNSIGRQYPIEGMRLQLDPSLTDKDFDRWGLTREGRIVASALQRYGMYLGLGGGAMKLEVQLLGPSREANLREWERRFPGFYKTIKKIPTDRLRVLYTGEPVTRIFPRGMLRQNSAMYE